MRIEASSFRDNSGFIFYEKGEIFRAISSFYKDNYEHLIKSGLYNHLTEKNLLIPHTDAVPGSSNPDTFKIIKPEEINFVSYPYEWSFSQLKDAALTTLHIHKIALKHGMVLKDSSAYNIQFYKGKAILIDTLSFEIYKENEPWVAYSQFCKNFLAPLALAAFCDQKLTQLLKNFIDGIPLDTAKYILRKKAFVRPGIFIHIFLHSYFQNKYSNESKNVSVNKKWMNKNSQLSLIESLGSIVKGLNLKSEKTNWSSYYSDQHHSKNYLDEKKKLVAEYLDKAKPGNIWDIGANDGEFSKIAAEKSNLVIAFDSDHNCIDNFYKYVKDKNAENILPLIMDFTNPSSSIGWANSERKSLTERANADLVMALAIIHHLCISNNVPIGYVSEFFSRLCNWLIIEFVPKSDPLVKKLLLNRKDIFINYTTEAFEREFQKYFTVVECRKIPGSERIIYLMKKLI